MLPLTSKPNADASFLEKVRWEIVEEIHRRQPDLILDLRTHANELMIQIRKLHLFPCYVVVGEIIEVTIDDDFNLYGDFPLVEPGSIEAAVEYLLTGRK
jgi:hypothetical protein